MRCGIILFLLTILTPVSWGSNWTEGHKTLLYIRVDFSDLPGDPVSTRELRITLAKVEKYFWENSYGNLTIKTAFCPTVRLPRPAAFYEADKDQQDIIRDAREGAKKLGFDSASYTLDIVAFRTLHGGDSELAAIGGKGARILNNFRCGITLHAIGHNLGLPHSSFWRTTDGTILGEGASEEYGDWYDPMGGGGNEDAPRNHLVIRSKAILGWLGKNGLTNVTTSGTYPLFAQDLPGAGPRGLHLVRDDKIEYWVEFRQLVPENSNMMNGIRILRSYKNRNAVDLLNMNPDSPNGVGDAPLLLGHTFCDPDAGIYITPVGVRKTTPPSMDVVVKLGKFVQSPPPALSITARTNTPGRGRPLDLKCEAAPASGLLYSWDFGDGTFEAGHAATQHIWKEDDRDYLVRASVTDMQGQSASQLKVITIGIPSTGQITGTVMADGKPLDGARINIEPADSAAAELLRDKSKPVNNTTLSDSSGNFALVGVSKGFYIIRLFKTGYYILPMKVLCPNPRPLKFLAIRPGEQRIHAPGVRTVPLHIHATIDGSDELSITTSGATWRHFDWSWPENITVNDLPMNPHQGLKNAGQSLFLPQNVRLDSAVILKKSGRGSIDMWLQGKALVIHFNDPQNGAGDYDLEIELETGRE